MKGGGAVGQVAIAVVNKIYNNANVAPVVMAMFVVFVTSAKPPAGFKFFKVNYSQLMLVFL